MLYEIALSGLFLALALASVAVFFCELEAAPSVARRMARAVRYRLPVREKSEIRFW